MEYAVKFKVSGDDHYMNVPADNPNQAKAIFQEWLFGEAGEMDHLPNAEWREIEVHGSKVAFRNDWVSSFEVLPRALMIRGEGF